MDPRCSNNLHRVNEYLYIWEGNTPVDSNCIEEENIDNVLFTSNPTISNNDIIDKCIIIDLKNKWDDDISRAHSLMKNYIESNKTILVVSKESEYDSYILIFLYFNNQSKANYESLKEEFINKFKIPRDMIFDNLKRLENWLDIHDPFSLDLDFLDFNMEFNGMNENIENLLNNNPVKYDDIEDNSSISTMEDFDTNSNHDMILIKNNNIEEEEMEIEKEMSFPITKDNRMDEEVLIKTKKQKTHSNITSLISNGSPSNPNFTPLSSSTSHTISSPKQTSIPMTSKSPSRSISSPTPSVPSSIPSSPMKSPTLSTGLSPSKSTPMSFKLKPSIPNPSSQIISSIPLTTLPLPIPLKKETSNIIDKENMENQSKIKSNHSMLEKPSKLKRPLPCEQPSTKALKITVKKVKTTKSKVKKPVTKQPQKKKKRIKLSDLFPSQLLRPNMQVTFRKKVGVLTNTGQISYNHKNFKSPSEFTDHILRELDYSAKTRANPWVEIKVEEESLHDIREKFYELENNIINENKEDNDDDDVVEYNRPKRIYKKNEVKKVAVKKINKKRAPIKKKKKIVNSESESDSDSSSKEIDSDETEFVPSQNSPPNKKK